MPELKEVQRQMESIERLVREIEQLPDAAAQSLARQLVQSLMDLHGAGLERILELVHGSGETGQQIIDRMAGDDLVNGLLLLYGLHPLDLETRLRQAIEQTASYLKLYSASAELVGVTPDGAVTVRVDAASHGCGSTASQIHAKIEQAIYDAAPDISGVHFEDVAHGPATGFVPLSNLSATLPKNAAQPLAASVEP